MTKEQYKVAQFLGAKLVPQKASNDKKSNTTLDYNNVVFPDNILPQTAAFKNLPFDTDWNWLMRAVIYFYDKASESTDLEFRGAASHLVSTLGTLRKSFIFQTLLNA